MKVLIWVLNRRRCWRVGRGGGKGDGVEASWIGGMKWSVYGVMMCVCDEVGDEV